MQSYGYLSAHSLNESVFKHIITLFRLKLRDAKETVVRESEGKNIIRACNYTLL